MKLFLKNIILLVTLFFSLHGSVLSQDEFIELKPRYRSKADRDHYNKRDLLGKRWGVWKIYNRSKTLISEIEYERGRKNGVYMKYNGSTGKAIIVKNYVYGKLDGPYEKYTALGELLVEGEYLLGKKTGVWTYNFPNGTVRKTGTYINNLKEGPWEFYNRKEDLLRTIIYKKGLPPAVAVPVVKKEVKKKKKKKVIRKKKTGTTGG